MAKKTVEINANLKEKFEIDLNARHFNMTIDQPPPGGNDNGPTPLEYFLSSLAGCFCSIGRIVAIQRKIDLNAVEVRVEGDIGDKNKTQNPGFDDIRVYVKLDAPLTKEEKEEFIREVDKRCPVSFNIKNESNIDLILE